jgi:hypothetical protein
MIHTVGEWLWESVTGNTQDDEHDDRKILSSRDPTTSMQHLYLRLSIADLFNWQSCLQRRAHAGVILYVEFSKSEYNKPLVQTCD